MDAYDVVVIGAGVAGMQAAFKAWVRDQRVALVEKERLGGTCLTRGCIPTKAMVRSAEVAHLASRGKEFGIEIEGLRADLVRVVERKDEIVDRIVAVNEEEVEAADGIDLYRGQACFLDEHRLRIGDQEIQGERFILATGAKPMIPDWPGIDEVAFLTSRGFLDMTDQPDHMLVIGGGYIGLECAQIMARLGTPVTLLQRSTILKEEDRELVEILKEQLIEDGVEVLEGWSVESLEQEGQTRKVHARHKDGQQRVFEGDALLIAIGRSPNDTDLGLTRAGVETWGAGWVQVDDRMQTSQDHIWAVGDAIGKQLFTHVARYEVEVAVANMLDGEDEKIDYWAAPYAVFTAPELARVGMLLEEAEAAGYDAEETTFTYEHLGKALCLGEEEGMMKVVADKESGELLGFHILADHAGELIHEAVVQMHKHGTVDDLADAIHIHPTMAEGVNDAAFDMAIELGRRRF